jgi:hypothetical protein
MAKEIVMVENSIKVEEAWNGPSVVMTRALQLPHKPIKPKQARILSAKSRRKLAVSGRKGGQAKKHPKDLTRFVMGLSKVGKKNPASKLTESQVLDIIVALEEGGLRTLIRLIKSFPLGIQNVITCRKWLTGNLKQLMSG